MSVVRLNQKRMAPPQAAYKRAKRVYAITFDLDGKIAEAMCGASWRGTCYAKIQSVFAEHGFGRVQGSVYFGDQDSDAVRCVLAVQDADRRFSWFGRAVRDLRMLRVDEDNDLLPLLSNRLRLNGENAA
ncbi:virulence factor [Sphingomonas oligoaromativorans]|uniref:virulence factor n=1 Tax=Sphingomonas oligoaromativorans TaxID=575322 RepID=UPI001FBB803B|nr:virulence factor [Sphingomonas oligoaromativorans]NIJ34093.1 virulence-associated protein VapD [Sphingomonas oligoaromativorans]